MAKEKTVELKPKVEKISKEHLDKLFNTDIMKFFYSEDDIKNMYHKYK